MRMSVPSDGCVGGRPTPRNDSVASSRIASPSFRVKITSTGPITLGRMCVSMMRKDDSPITRAAMT